VLHADKGSALQRPEMGMCGFFVVKFPSEIYQLPSILCSVLYMLSMQEALVPLSLSETL
jgi:hypothetical protein